MGNKDTDFFKGFVVQARDPATNRPVGVFTVDNADAKTIKCVEVDGVSHI
jgi:Reeler domain